MKGTGNITGLECPQAKRLFSPYLDGAVTGSQMLALQRHLSDCATCNGEYQGLRRTQQLLVNMRRPKVPADLGLKLRLAISRETEAAKRGRLEGVKGRLENAFEAFMVPATAGFLSALIIFGIAMVYFVAPSSLQAGNDVPLVMVNTAPQLQQSAFGMTLDTIDADSLVIEAYVDANGLEPGSHELPLQVTVPDGMQLMRQSPDKVRIRMYHERLTTADDEHPS